MLIILVYKKANNFFLVEVQLITSPPQTQEARFASINKYIAVFLAATWTSF